MALVSYYRRIWAIRQLMNTNKSRFQSIWIIISWMKVLHSFLKCWKLQSLIQDWRNMFDYDVKISFHEYDQLLIVELPIAWLYFIMLINHPKAWFDAHGSIQSWLRKIKIPILRIICTFYYGISVNDSSS